MTRSKFLATVFAIPFFAKIFGKPASQKSGLFSVNRSHEETLTYKDGELFQWKSNAIGSGEVPVWCCRGQSNSNSWPNKAYRLPREEEPLTEEYKKQYDKNLKKLIKSLRL